MKRQTSEGLTSVYGWRQERVKIAIDSDSNSRPPPPNLPRPDLLTGSGEYYFTNGIPLYEASIAGDWKRAKAIFDKNPHLVRYSLTKNGETSLHIVVSTYRTKQAKEFDEFVENLVHLMNEEDMTLQTRNYNTALYLASATGNIKAVEIMLEKNKALLTIPGGDGQIMPLYAAVLFGSYGVVQYLYKNSHKLQDDGWTEMNRGLLLEKCVERCFFDVAIEILKDRPELASNGNVLRILAGKTDAFQEPIDSMTQRIEHYMAHVEAVGEYDFHLSDRLKIIWEYYIARKPDSFLLKKLKVHREALELLKIIWENIAKKPKREMDEILKGPKDAVMQVTNLDSGTVEQDAVKNDEAETHSSQVLFIAAESGNTGFIVEILRRYPDLIWSVNDSSQSIFHIAVKHRHADIYNLLDEIGSMKHMITSLIDDRGNNMLHLVGNINHQQRLRDESENFIMMQEETFWFKEISRIIHPGYNEQKNEDGLTPDKLFSTEHKDLAVEAASSMKKVAGQCMVVAALIATMVFTAAYTVPGGYHQTTGYPIFHSNLAFDMFVFADAASLFSSILSLVCFIRVFLDSSLSTILNCYPIIYSFLRMGIANLLLSLLYMSFAFCASLFLLYHKAVLWVIPVYITILACVTVYMYGCLYLSLYRVSASNLFKRKKQYSLYHRNPQV